MQTALSVDLCTSFVLLAAAMSELLLENSKAILHLSVTERKRRILQHPNIAQTMCTRPLSFIGGYVLETSLLSLAHTIGKQQ